MKLPILLFAAALCAAPPEAPAAALVRDLGQGLSYYRVHELPSDLPSPPSGRPGPCVLDLRYAKAGEIAASALRAWVKFNVTTRAPIFVLENAATSPTLLASLAGNSTPSLVQSLLNDFPDKPRVDEAYLEKEHIADVDAPEVAADKASPAAPLVDAMLQRAVQLHRGLLALKRI